jgi:hypothetical protein
MSDEKRLIKRLLESYERVGVVGRPVFNTSMTIRVNFGLALIQILDLDEKNQVLTTNVWSRYVSLFLSPPNDREFVRSFEQCASFGVCRQMASFEILKSFRSLRPNSCLLISHFAR